MVGVDQLGDRLDDIHRSVSFLLRAVRRLIVARVMISLWKRIAFLEQDIHPPVPLNRLMSRPLFWACSRNAGSAVIASKAARNTATRSAGTPGGSAKRTGHRQIAEHAAGDLAVLRIFHQIEQGRNALHLRLGFKGDLRPAGLTCFLADILRLVRFHAGQHQPTKPSTSPRSIASVMSLEPR